MWSKILDMNLNLNYHWFYDLECTKPSLTSGVKIKPEKDSYNHGEKIEFECPNLKEYETEGIDSSTCDDGSFKPAITFKCHKSKKFYLLMFCI